jgi:hypothetical protein
MSSPTRARMGGDILDPLILQRGICVYRKSWRIGTGTSYLIAGFGSSSSGFSLVGRRCARCFGAGRRFVSQTTLTNAHRSILRDCGGKDSGRVLRLWIVSDDGLRSEHRQDEACSILMPGPITQLLIGPRRIAFDRDGLRLANVPATVPATSPG